MHTLELTRQESAVPLPRGDRLTLSPALCRLLLKPSQGEKFIHRLGCGITPTNHGRRAQDAVAVLLERNVTVLFPVDF